MNWSKTKSIFIICFLLLDAFLVFELYTRQQDDAIQSVNSSSGTQKSFHIDAQIPATPNNVTFLRGERINFQNEKKSLALINNSNGTVNQKIRISDDGMQVASTLVKPVKGSIRTLELQKNLLGLVYQGQSYVYWQSERKNGTADFVQLYNGHPVFVSHRSNILMLEFSVKGKQVTGYQQSFFRFRQVNNVDIISAQRAITNLAENTNLLEYGRPTIQVVELGYINLVGNAGSDPLIFIPAWHIVVETAQHQSQEFFVNAMSGSVQQLN